MKKFLALFLALLMIAFSFASCEEMEDLFGDDLLEGETQSEEAKDESVQQSQNESESKGENDQGLADDTSETYRNPWLDWIGGNENAEVPNEETEEYTYSDSENESWVVDYTSISTENHNTDYNRPTVDSDIKSDTDKPIEINPDKEKPTEPDADYPYSEYPDYTSPDVFDTEFVDPETFTSDHHTDCDWETFPSRDEYEDFYCEPTTISILIRNAVAYQKEWYKDVPEDEVDEVIAMRNSSVSALTNVVVEYTLMSDSSYEECLSLFNQAIMEDLDNDFHYYDVVANHAYASANELIRDYLTNIADREDFPHFDFSLPCWNQSMVKSTMIDDQLYYITGDINLSTFDNATVMFVNKDLYSNKRSASDPEDIQDEALEGNWDYEDLYTWSSVYEDLNGNANKDHEDFYGISAGLSAVSIDALPYAWDIEFIVEARDGSHEHYIRGNDKLSCAFDMAKALFYGVDDSNGTAYSEGVGNWNNTQGCTLGGYSEPVTHFANDTSVFLVTSLNAESVDAVLLHEMSSEFGLLPMPKFDEEQENYGTTAQDSYTLISVLDHSQSTEKTQGKAISAYLELLAEKSYTDVRAYYANSVVKQKYFGLTDTYEKSYRLFEIIADNVEFSFASVYAPQLANIITNCWRDVISPSDFTRNRTPEYLFSLDEQTYEITLEDVDKWLGLR